MCDIFCVRWSWDCSVLCCAGLDWDTRVLLLCWAPVGPVVPVWWMLLLLVYRWIWVVFFSGRRAWLSFPRLSGATPRPWQCRCPWGVQISSSSMGALYADLFGSGHTGTERDREHWALINTANRLHSQFTSAKDKGTNLLCLLKHPVLSLSTSTFQKHVSKSLDTAAHRPNHNVSVKTK